MKNPNPRYYWRKTDKEKRICYLLHFAHDDGRIEHYAGTTTRGRLQYRLDRHRRGAAQGATRHAYVNGFKFTYVLIIGSDDPWFERTLKIGAIGALSCPLCNDASPYQTAEQYRYDPSPGIVDERLKPIRAQHDPPPEKRPRRKPADRENKDDPNRGNPLEREHKVNKIEC